MIVQEGVGRQKNESVRKEDPPVQQWTVKNKKVLEWQREEEVYCEFVESEELHRNGMVTCDKNTCGQHDESLSVIC